MIKDLTGTSIYLLAGMSATLSADGELAKGGKAGSVNHNGETRALVRGYLVDNPDVGDISIDGIPDSEGATVKYIHYKAQNNAIYFYSAIGSPPDVAIVNVVAVPIHDHSSIVQGGPAYGTYFSDDMVVRKE
ncbi:MAG: hypothetical protein DRP42_01435 [Tenericutes bacterium]|nr:MAG: hypothetical protein DRP42_01435 [Mycoplasmatota bacterium]